MRDFTEIHERIAQHRRRDNDAFRRGSWQWDADNPTRTDYEDGDAHLRWGRFSTEVARVERKARFTLD